MPVALAQETRSIELWPLKGKIGETINVIGQGFNKSTESTDKYAAILFSSQEATTSDDIGDQVEAYKLVAEGVLLGAYIVRKRAIAITQIMQISPHTLFTSSFIKSPPICLQVSQILQP